MMIGPQWHAALIAACRLLARSSGALATGILAAVLSATPAAAQQRIVEGVVVNLGIVPAAVALRADGHREAHPANPPSGAQHVLVTLDEEKGGKRIGDAEVVVEVTDPRGHVEKKPLLHTQGGGLPDYSELFHFGWPGQYAVRVIITRSAGARPIQTQFAVSHQV